MAQSDQSKLPDFSDYIVFVDESGSPTLKPLDPHYPIFVLVFCVVHKETYTNQIQPAFKKLKFDFFGHDMTALHSHDIRKPKGEFKFLMNSDLRAAFLARLDGILTDAKFELISHVIDKEKLATKYVNPFDPYNIALRLNLEQLSIFLKENDQSGKLTHLIAESRGKKEDNSLELEFYRILDPLQNWGMADNYSFSATPFELIFVEKKINSAGLQMADLTGHPIGRNFLKPDQNNHAFEIVKQKIYKNIWSFP